MRKRLLLIFTILLSVFIISDVNAAGFIKDHEGKLEFWRYKGNSVGSGIWFYDNFTGDGFPDEDREISIYEYGFQSKDGTADFQNLVGYCMDSNLSGSSNIVLKRVFFSDHDETSSYDAAAFEILLKGYGAHNNSYIYKDPNGNSVNLTGQDLEHATSLALRALTLGVYRYGKFSVNVSPSLTEAYIALGVKWASERFDSELAKKLFGATIFDNAALCNSECQKVCKKFSQGDDAKACFEKLNLQFYGSQLYGDNGINESRDSYLFALDANDNRIPIEQAQGYTAYKIYYGARALFLEAIDAAEDYVDNGRQQASVSFSKISSDSTQGNLNATTSEEIIFNVSIQGMPDVGFVNNVKFSCQDCASYGIKLVGTYYQSGKAWLPLTDNMDLSEYVDANGNVRIKFELSKDPNQECDPVNYLVTYKMYDPGSIYTAAALYDAEGIDTQRFIVLVENTDITGAGDAITGYSGTITCDKVPCQTSITAPKCADESYIYCTEDKEEAFYTTSYVELGVESGRTYSYTIKLDDIDPDKVSQYSVALQSKSVSYFESEKDYRDYIEFRDKNSSLVTDGNAANNNSANVYMSNLDEFMKASLGKNNFDFEVSPVKMHNDEYYYVEVTITIKNVNGAVPYSSNNVGQVYFVPLKFTVLYSSLDKCVVDSADLAGEYSDAGYSVGMVDDSDLIGSVKAPEKIKSCIIENIDDAKNSYQLSDDNNGVDNKYCEVFCKEDYAKIQLNELIETATCGGFFKLEARIEGSKDCYTGSSNTSDYSIDENQFLADIETAQADMVAAMNDLLGLKDARNTNNIGETDAFCATCCAVEGTSYHSYSVNTGTYTGYQIINVDQRTGVGSLQTVSLDRPTKSMYRDNVLYADSAYSGECNEKDESDPNSVATCKTGCVSGSKTMVQKIIDVDITTAKAKLATAIADYEKALSDYNACTTGWENVFQFEEIDIEWEYDQIYFNKLKSDKDKYLVPVENSFASKSEIEVCDGNTNEAYECQGTAYKFLAGQNATLGTYNYSDTYESAFVLRDYVKCEIVVAYDGTETPQCVVDTAAYVSKADFVRKSVSAEQNYITPTVYAQIANTGKITVDLGYTGDKLQLDILENMLPVSLDTEGGGNFYLRLKDIGEFYNNGELGRLFDFDDENEDKSVAYAHSLNSSDTFTGEYICNYVTECRPTDCDPDDPESPGYNENWREDGWVNACIPEGPGTPDCPDCDYSCWDEPGTPWDDCEWIPCDESGCRYECINCLFNFSDLQLYFKTISTTNFNSANREYGFNWITNTTYPQLSLIADKSQTTIEEIEDANETIYNETIDKDSNDETSLDFSITLTPELTREIQDYNVKVESEGGYANDSLTCYDYTDDNGNVYPNIFCYSDFLDELFELANGDEDIIFAPNRTNNNRNIDANSQGYWTPWPNYKYVESVIGGPSWK